MNHLSGMDAVFLHFESPETPMHVGALNVLKLPEGYNGDFFEDVKAFMERRLHLAEVFTRKLALMPFDLSNPVWVEDEDIDLEHHIRHITLPKPGSNRQLQQAISRLHSSLLDRSRPLWEMVVIDGLRSGEVGLYSKFHHAAIDGQAGAEVGRAIFDLTAAGRQIKPPRQKLRRNQYQLGMAELATAAVRNTIEQYVKLLRMAPEMARAAKALMPTKEDGMRQWKPSRLTGFLAPKTPLNVAITNQRSFSGRTVPVSEIKFIARQLDVSFNDVVMATVSGALRRYLQESHELPTKPLVAAAPMSLREAGDATNNNQVGMMTIDLATDEADPLARLKRINDNSTQRKSTMNSIRGAIPMDFPMFAAPWLMSGFASLYGRSRLANVLPPMANVVISNVAGIPAELYFAGAQVVSYYPVSIVTHGLALNITVQSYNGRLDYGLVACRRALPDLNDLGDALLAEHRLLMELARQHGSAEAAAPAADAPSAGRAKAPSSAVIELASGRSRSDARQRKVSARAAKAPTRRAAAAAQPALRIMKKNG